MGHPCLDGPWEKRDLWLVTGDMLPPIFQWNNPWLLTSYITNSMANLSGSTPICWWIQFPIEMAMGIENCYDLKLLQTGSLPPKKRIGSAGHMWFWWDFSTYNSGVVWECWRNLDIWWFQTIENTCFNTVGKSPANRLKRVKKSGNWNLPLKESPRLLRTMVKPWLESLILYKIRFIFWIVSNIIKIYSNC